MSQSHQAYADSQGCHARHPCRSVPRVAARRPDALVLAPRAPSSLPSQSPVAAWARGLAWPFRRRGGLPRAPARRVAVADPSLCHASVITSRQSSASPLPIEAEACPKGYLDEQFFQVEDLQDEANPNFAEEVVSLFFKDSARVMLNIEQAIEKYPKDFARWDAHMQQLKGSCSSIGASRVKNECTSFRNFCGEENAEGYLCVCVCFHLYDIWHGKGLHVSSIVIFPCPWPLLWKEPRSCMRSFQKLKREHAVLRQKLESYFQLLRQAGPVGTAPRPAAAGK